MSKPRNIILLVVDSLRYDTVHDRGVRMPYAEKNAIRFDAARSSGCWTLPATASLFSGLVPHEHGASAQTRKILDEIPTLAETLKKGGYGTYQVTGNPVTTEIFGLNRGFDEVIKIWDHATPKFKRLLNFVLMAGKPRVRKQLFSKDFVTEKLSEDLKVGICWSQNTYDDIFNQVRGILEKNEAQNKGSFIFMNLMEAHFPYHVAPTFKLTAEGLYDKFQEAAGLYHTLNQSFLKQDKEYVKPRIEKIIRERQYKSWDILSQPIDAFLQEMHQDKENLVIFCSDHGDNFGEQNWVYHFSNVTDAGNRVPLFWLPHNGEEPRSVSHPVSSRFICNDIIRSTGVDWQGGSLFEEGATNLPVLQSYWYNNQGKTMPRYKYNQMCFIQGEDRFVYRDDMENTPQWLTAKVAKNGDAEPKFEPISNGFDPIEEAVQDGERKAYLKDAVRGFNTFSRSLKKKPKSH